MITFDEMRAIANVKRQNEECKRLSVTAQTQLVQTNNTVALTILTSVNNLIDTIDWFIRLVEREVRIPCNPTDIAIAERLEYVKRGMARRNNG